MFTQVFIGYALIIMSVILQVFFIEIAARTIKRFYIESNRAPLSFRTFVFTMSGVMFWFLISLSIIIWMWGAVLIEVGVFETLEESLYFSLVAFTTLGFGDDTLPSNWRLLSGFIAADGFVLFGLNTAVFLEVMIRLRRDE